MGLGTAITQSLMALFLAWVILQCRATRGVELSSLLPGSSQAAGASLLVRTLAPCAWPPPGDPGAR